jgi:hypothetical protein
LKGSLAMPSVFENVFNSSLVCGTARVVTMINGYVKYVMNSQIFPGCSCVGEHASHIGCGLKKYINYYVTCLD